MRRNEEVAKAVGMLDRELAYLERKSGIYIPDLEVQAATTWL